MRYNQNGGWKWNGNLYNISKIQYMCDTMSGIHCVGVGASQRIPLCVLGRNPHKELVHKISYETGRGWGKKGPRAEQRNWQKRPGQRTGQSAGESRRLLGSMDSEAGLANVRGWVSIPGGFVGISLEYTLVLAHRCTVSYTKVLQTSPFLRLELTRFLFFLFSFLPPSLLCMLCFVCP